MSLLFFPSSLLRILSFVDRAALRSASLSICQALSLFALSLPLSLFLSLSLSLSFSLSPSLSPSPSLSLPVSVYAFFFFVLALFVSLESGNLTSTYFSIDMTIPSLPPLSLSLSRSVHPLSLPLSLSLSFSKYFPVSIFFSLSCMSHFCLLHLFCRCCLLYSYNESSE